MTKALRLFLGFVFLILIGVDVVLGASVTVANVSCPSYTVQQSAGNVILTCDASQGTPAPSPLVPSPVSIPTPAPVLPTTGCTVKDLFSASSRLQTTGPGQAQAYSFIASNGGQLKTQYPTANLYISVSPTACEFVNVPVKCAASGYVEPGLYYSASDPRKCILTPGQTYYFNVRTAVKDAAGALVETCPGATCYFMPAIF